MYDKILLLDNLNHELNKDNPKTFKQLKNLSKQSLQVLLTQEKRLEEKSKKENRMLFREFLIENIAKPRKSEFVEKRILSDWQLEKTYYDFKNKEFFIKLVSEDSYEFKQNQEYEEKLKEEDRKEEVKQLELEMFFN